MFGFLVINIFLNIKKIMQEIQQQLATAKALI